MGRTPHTAYRRVEALTTAKVRPPPMPRGHQQPVTETHVADRDVVVATRATSRDREHEQRAVERPVEARRTQPAHQRVDRVDQGCGVLLRTSAVGSRSPGGGAGCEHVAARCHGPAGTTLKEGRWSLSTGVSDGSAHGRTDHRDRAVGVPQHLGADRAQEGSSHAPQAAASHGHKGRPGMERPVDQVSCAGERRPPRRCSPLRRGTCPTRAPRRPPRAPDGDGRQRPAPLRRSSARAGRSQGRRCSRP